jgi:hypothetical protein
VKTILFSAVAAAFLSGVSAALFVYATETAMQGICR